MSEEDKSSSHSSCESDCQKSEDSNRSDLTEFEVVTSSSSESDCFKDDFTSDSSSDVNYEVKMKYIMFIFKKCKIYDL